MTYTQTEQYYNMLADIHLANMARDFEYAARLQGEMNEVFPQEMKPEPVQTRTNEIVAVEEKIDWLEMLYDASEEMLADELTAMLEAEMV